MNYNLVQDVEIIQVFINRSLWINGIKKSFWCRHLLGLHWCFLHHFNPPFYYLNLFPIVPTYQDIIRNRSVLILKSQRSLCPSLYLHVFSLWRYGHASVTPLVLLTIKTKLNLQNRIGSLALCVTQRALLIDRLNQLLLTVKWKNKGKRVSGLLEGKREDLDIDPSQHLQYCIYKWRYRVYKRHNRSYWRT